MKSVKEKKYLISQESLNGSFNSSSGNEMISSWELHALLVERKHTEIRKLWFNSLFKLLFPTTGENIWTIVYYISLTNYLIWLNEYCLWPEVFYPMTLQLLLLNSRSWPSLSSKLTPTSLEQPPRCSICLYFYPPELRGTILSWPFSHWMSSLFAFYSWIPCSHSLNHL